MMIDRKGNVYINSKLQKRKYDRNEPWGADNVNMGAGHYEIVKEIKIFGFKVTISKYRFISAGSFSTLAYDPPENVNA